MKKEYVLCFNILYILPNINDNSFICLRNLIDISIAKIVISLYIDKISPKMRKTYRRLWIRIQNGEIPRELSKTVFPKNTINRLADFLVDYTLYN